MSPVLQLCTGSTRLRSYDMTHRSQMSVTWVTATLYFSVFGSNDRPPTKLSAFLAVGQRQKKKHSLSHFILSTTFAKQIATPVTCGLPLKTTQNHMCESPIPSHTHIHAQATWCRWSGVIRGKPKSKEQVLKITGLADRPSFPLSGRNASH